MNVQSQTRRPPRSKPKPGRPRSFDCDEVLERAIVEFWRNGYDATTYADLETATGQYRQSLIYAFGDKEAFFKSALRRYVDRRAEVVRSVLAGPGSPARCIASALDLWLADAERPVTRGCLAVNIAGELGGNRREIAAIVESGRRRLIAAFTDAFKRAAHAGQVCSRADPRLLAELAVAAGDGAMLHARNVRSARSARRAFKALLSTVLK